MKLAIAQINCILGDLAGNSAKILAFAERARQQGAQLLLTPELSLCGYPPEDLLLRKGFYQACNQSLQKLARQVWGLSVLVGHPHEIDNKRYNAVSVLCDGKIVSTYYKHELPNDAVFDERRYFVPGESSCIFEIQGIKFGLGICADVWEEHVVQSVSAAGAKVLLVANASPYHIGKQELRYEIIRDRIARFGLTVIYANMVGGQDELVFDGASFAMDEQGVLTHQLVSFEESLGLIEFRDGKIIAGDRISCLTDEESIYRALCLGVRDYVGKNGFSGVILGLSGGIDSALTLAIAVDALGADCVRAVMMPSPFTAQMSLDDAREMASTLAVHYDEISIKPLLDAYLASLHGLFEGRAQDTAEENIQARIRGNLLMALSNKFGSLVLTTGNKSEMAVGYCTLYGDMAGGFAVLKDLSKTWVYRLAVFRNKLGRVIPERIISRPPSAELKPDQKDQDSLPSYDVLDGIMSLYVEQNLTIAEIGARGYAKEDVERVVKMIHASEYKRVQSPVGARITDRGFGKDWRFPVTVRYQDDF